MPESLIRINPTASFIDESGGFYLLLGESRTGCVWDAWRECYLAMWDGIAGRWRRI